MLKVHNWFLDNRPAPLKGGLRRKISFFLNPFLKGLGVSLKKFSLNYDLARIITI